LPVGCLLHDPLSLPATPAKLATHPAPESYTLDSALLARPGNDDIQLNPFLDYASNVALYPKFQEYFSRRRSPFIARGMGQY
jgi:hypothetical protein